MRARFNSDKIVPGRSALSRATWTTFAARETDRGQEAGRKAAYSAFLAEVGEGISRNGDVLDVVRIGAFEAGRCRQIGKSSPVLDAVQSLFFDRRHELAIAEQSRGRVTVKGV